MAGHSKFKNIMHRKGAQDKKRAKMFTKLGREVQVAAKMGGGDPDMNPRLRLAIQAAKSHSMPKDNIERAINKGVGGGSDADNFEEMRYEGYGPGGTSVIVEALTDNKNRTASEVRAAFSKNGGNLGETGSVGFNFDRVGRIVYPIDAGDADHVFEQALEAGAEDVASSDEEHEIFCAPDDLNDVRIALESALGEATECAFAWKSLNTTELNEDKAQTMIKLIDALEDNDDVQNVTANFEIPDDVMEKLAE